MTIVMLMKYTLFCKPIVQIQSLYISVYLCISLGICKDLVVIGIIALRGEVGGTPPPLPPIQGGGLTDQGTGPGVDRLGEKGGAIRAAFLPIAEPRDVNILHVDDEKAALIPATVAAMIIAPRLRDRDIRLTIQEAKSTIDTRRSEERAASISPTTITIAIIRNQNIKGGKIKKYNWFDTLTCLVIFTFYLGIYKWISSHSWTRVHLDSPVTGTSLNQAVL